MTATTTDTQTLIEWQNEAKAAMVRELRQTLADIERAPALRRELGMLRMAQAHLSGIPARHNAARIAERASELARLVSVEG